MDVFTEELYAELCTIAGKCPTAVISRLHRSIMDSNRDKDESTFGIPQLEAVWEQFHAIIDEAKETMPEGGLYLDLQGHGHSNQWAEMGCLISGEELDSKDKVLDPRDSSIRSLGEKETFEHVLRGEKSLGGMLEENGYQAVPSPGNPGPSGEKYYYGAGSYNVKRHGSRDGGNVDGIQVMMARIYRTSDEDRPGYISALAKAVVRFVWEHYPPPPASDNGTSGEETVRAMGMVVVVLVIVTKVI